MAITNGYGDLTGYKLRFFDGETDDHEDDPILEASIEAVSRFIDDVTGRRFYRNSTDETRYFTAADKEACFIDDIGTITTLKTDGDGDLTYEDTWDTGDYRTLPINAALDGEPYTYLKLTPQANYIFPSTPDGVEIIGKFGYSSSTPSQIGEACYLGAHRLQKRLATPLGVSASAALGQLQVRVSDLKSDPDFMLLIDPFIKRV